MALTEKMRPVNSEEKKHSMTSILKNYTDIPKGKKKVR